MLRLTDRYAQKCASCTYELIKIYSHASDKGEGRWEISITIARMSLSLFFQLTLLSTVITTQYLYPANSFVFFHQKKHLDRPIGGQLLHAKGLRMNERIFQCIVSENYWLGSVVNAKRNSNQGRWRRYRPSCHAKCHKSQHTCAMNLRESVRYEFIICAYNV